MPENGANLQKISMARGKQIKNMGSTFMDMVKQVCLRGRSRIKRPLCFKPSHGGKIIVEMDSRRE